MRLQGLGGDGDVRAVARRAQTDGQSDARHAPVMKRVLFESMGAVPRLP